MLTAYGVGSVEHIRFFKIGSAVTAESPSCGLHGPPHAMQRYRIVMVRPNRDLHPGVSCQLSAASLCNAGRRYQTEIKGGVPMVSSSGPLPSVGFAGDDKALRREASRMRRMLTVADITQLIHPGSLPRRRARSAPAAPQGHRTPALRKGAKVPGWRRTVRPRGGEKTSAHVAVGTGPGVGPRNPEVRFATGSVTFLNTRRVRAWKRLVSASPAALGRGSDRCTGGANPARGSGGRP
jgi:hypothetical protein